MFNFFSNNIIYVDGEQLEIEQSLKNTREEEVYEFTVPNHTVGTPNLLIFLDGKLKIAGRDYEDYTSNSIIFLNKISISSDFVAVLVKNKSETSLEWEYF